MSQRAALRASAYYRLLGNPAILALTVPDLLAEPARETADLGRDDVGGPWSEGWVFQGLEDIRPFRDVEGTGLSAIVVRVVDSWGVNAHNTAQMPTLQVLVWSDCSRSEDGSPTMRDAQDRCERVCEAVDALLHDPANRCHWWPDAGGADWVSVVSCVKAQGPSFVEVPESDGGVRGELRYEVML